MLAFASVIGSEDRFRAHALPGLQRVAEPDTVIAEYRDAPSTAAAYNEVLDALWGRDDLEGLVLVPEDAEILDPGFCARLRRRLAEPGVAVIDAGPLLVLSPWAVRELRFGDGDIRERAR